MTRIGIFVRIVAVIMLAVVVRLYTDDFNFAYYMFYSGAVAGGGASLLLSWVYEWVEVK